jgi:hypothetical protein
MVDNCLKKIDSVLNGGKKSSENYLAMHFDWKSGSFACDIVSLADGVPAKNRKSTELEEADDHFRWQVIASKFLFDYPIIFRCRF